MTVRRKNTSRRKPAPGRLRPGLMWALLLTLPALAMFALWAGLEAGLRAWDRAIPEMTVPSGIEHPPYYNNPGRTTRAKVFGMHYRYRINSRGMRGPERPERKPPGTRRILILGDSLVFGAMVGDDQTLPVQLERLLGASAAGESWEVLNAGVGSYDIWDYEGYLQERGLAFAPDIVVIGLYLNDHEPRLASAVPEPAPRRLSARRRLWQRFLDLRTIRGLNQLVQRHQDPRRPLFSLRKSASPGVAQEIREVFGEDADSAAAMLRFLEDYRYRADVFLPALRSMLDLEKWRAIRPPLARIRGLCRRRGIRLMTVVFPVQFEFAPGYAHPEPWATIRAVHRGLGIPVYDAKVPLAAGGDPQALYRFRYDYTHFNAEGYARVAAALKGWLEERGWLRRRGSR